MIAPSADPECLSRLLADIDGVANQLCGAVDGAFAFSVDTDSQEPVIQKLAMLVNFVLDTACRSLAMVEQQRGELKVQEALYHGLFQHMSEGVLVCDYAPDGEQFVLTDINDTALRIEGVARDAVVGREMSEAFAGTAGPDLIAAMHEVAAMGTPRNLPAHRCVNDRVDYWCVSFIYRLPTGSLVVVYRDVTAQLAAERALCESLETTQRIVDTVPFAVAVIGYDHTIWTANAVACDILSLPPQELVGRDWRDFIADRDACVRLAHAAGGGVKAAECAARNSRGEAFPVLLSVIPISYRHQKAFLAAFADLTERQQMELQLRQAQKMEAVGGLAAGIAHEINTPTQYIGDNLHFLTDAFASLGRAVAAGRELGAQVRAGAATAQMVDDLEGALADADIPYFLEELPSALAQAHEGVSRVSQIVQAMKDFSHPGARQMAASDLNHAIRSTTVVSRNVWKYVADLECDLDPDLPPVTCLVDEFNQVILNLIVNAAHAIEDVNGRGSEVKGRITITTRRDGDGVEIRVRDTGAGIPESIRARLFDPFFTTKAVGRGTGQGLAIAHHVIVQKHHGTIGFESTIGQGSEFVIRLPLMAAPMAQDGDNP